VRARCLLLQVRSWPPPPFIHAAKLHYNRVLYPRVKGRSTRDGEEEWMP